MSRSSDPSHKNEKRFDVVVIGAGLHGTAMACEAASRGLSVLIVQAGQLGGTASCVPSNLTGPGLIKLEAWRFPEVLSNIAELKRLHRRAPHLSRPIQTFVKQDPATRAKLKVNLELTLLKRLQQKNQLPIDESVQTAVKSLAQWFGDGSLATKPIQELRINYSRTVIAMNQQALRLGCELLQYHTLVDSNRMTDHWQLFMQSSESGRAFACQGKILINCTGVHVNDLTKNKLKAKTRSGAETFTSAQLFIRLPQAWRAAVKLQQRDGSLINIHAFDNETICAGPIVAENDTDSAKQDAIKSFLDCWNKNALRSFSSDDIVHQRWSSRALVDDPSTKRTTRVDEVFIDLNNPGGAAPMLSLVGVNFLQHRKIAEQALDILSPFYSSSSRRRDNNILPGGDFGEQDVKTVIAQCQQRYDFLSKSTVERLVFNYGTHVYDILSNSHTEEALGEHFGHGLFACEVDYLQREEWAQSAEDVLWRRTYLGLKFSEQERERLMAYIGQ